MKSPIVLSSILLLALIPFPVATLAQTSDVTLLDSSVYVDQIGYYHLVGEVRNDVGYTINFVQVTATFYDSSDNVVATEYTFTGMGTLRYGEKSSFHITIADESQISKIASYSLSTSWYAAADKPAALVLNVGDDYIDEIGYYHLVGEVENTGSETATFVTVAAAFYDVGGEILDTGFTFTMSSIPPGQTSPFEIVIAEPYVTQIASVSANAQSMEYSSIIDDLPSAPEQPETETDDGDDEPIDIGSLFGDPIEGTYADSSAGLSIELPEGWSGLVLFDEFVIVSPEGVDFSSEQTATMAIIALERNSVEDVWTSPDDLESASDDVQSCGSESTVFASVNGMSAMQIEQECDDADGYSKSKIVGFMTETHFIVISYSATSEEAYDEHLAEYEQSMESLSIAGAMDFRSAVGEMLNLDSTSHAVTAVGTEVEVSIQSNSEVSDLQFSEEEKRLSFTVEGEDGTSGTALVVISSVLEPPYTVMLDGEAWTDFSVITDESTGEQILRLSYDHSVHEVSITGTNVVPEFPLGIIGMAAAVMTAIMVIGRFGGRFPAFRW